MRKILNIFLAAMFILSVSGCSGSGNAQGEVSEILPQLSQVQSICELSATECYYHNVAKSREIDAEGILFWKKDRHFWIEYNSVARYGVDVSKVNISVDGDDITITMPQAKLLDCTIDNSQDFKYIIEKGSAKISAEDERIAIEKAQEHLIREASENEALIRQAQQRAEELLKGYVDGINGVSEKTYKVKFVIVDDEGKVLREDAREESASEDSL